MKRNDFISIAGFFLMLLPSAFGLGQVAGKLVVFAPIGESNSTKFGLVNNENKTVTVNLSAEGEVAEYLSFQKTVKLPPKKITYILITATIPENYDTSNGGNLTGYLYATQKGESGQVSINVQAKKSITILIPDLVNVSNDEIMKEYEGLPTTGFVSAVQSFWPVAAVLLFLGGLFMFLRNYSIALIKKR